MTAAKLEQNAVNDSGTRSRSDTALTQPRSRIVRYELIDSKGRAHGPLYGLRQVHDYASLYWPDQEQDEDRTGKGWDIQIAGLR